MDKADIGYAWNFAADLGNGRQFSISGNFATDTTADDINKEVDKVRGVVDRQQAKSALLSANQEIEQLEFRVASAKKDLSYIDDQQKEKGHSNATRQQREAAVKHIEKMEDDIIFRKDFITKLEKEAK